MRFIYILGCYFVFLSHSLAQNIVFEGLKRTEEAYLRKFIGWTGEAKPDSNYLASVNQAIRNTRLFNEVHHELIIDGTDTTCKFICQEIKTLLPIVEGGSTKGNNWFRVGLLDENGRGKSIKTVIFYQYNDNHSFYLRQSFPLIFKSWGLNYLFRKWSFLEPFFFTSGKQYYNYTNLNAEISTSYAFEINRSELEIGLGYIDEKFTHKMPDTYTDSPDFFAQKKISFKTIHKYNHINHNIFYLHGWANTLNVLGTYELRDKMPFLSVFNDVRFFKKFPFKGNIALRQRIGIASNSNINIFLAPFVLDNYYNIRGIGNRIDRGTASFVINAEYRQTLWENKTWGTQVVAFCDSGTWRKPGGKLSDMLKTNNMVVFSGLGGRLIYKKAHDVILRLDYGWGMQGTGRGFVFGIGQYF